MMHTHHYPASSWDGRVANLIKALGSIYEDKSRQKLNLWFWAILPETNSSPMKITIFPGKYHQNGAFSNQRSVSLHEYIYR